MSGQPSPLKSAHTTPSPGPGRFPRPDRFGYVPKRYQIDAAPSPGSGAAEVAEQAGDLALERRGGAEVRSGRGAARPGSVVIDVVDHHEVEPAIAIVVEEGGGSGPAGVL